MERKLFNKGSIIKYVLILTLFLSSQLEVKSQSINLENNKVQVVKDYLQAAFNKDYSRQKTFMHQDIVDYHPTVLSPPAKGKEELINGWKNTMQSMDSIIYIRKGIGIVSFMEGELLGEWVVESGLVKSKFQGVEQWVEFQMTGLYKVESGLIKEVHNFGNTLDIYQQLGYSLEPPKKD